MTWTCIKQNPFLDYMYTHGNWILIFIFYFLFFSILSIRLIFYLLLLLLLLLLILLLIGHTTDGFVWNLTRPRSFCKGALAIPLFEREKKKKAPSLLETLLCHWTVFPSLPHTGAGLHTHCMRTLVFLPERFHELMWPVTVIAVREGPFFFFFSFQLLYLFSSFMFLYAERKAFIFFFFFSHF